MRAKIKQIGNIHFSGIGGIGMSGLAEILYQFGFNVQGSDINENANVIRLKKLGIPVFIGHSAENVKNANILVLSSAIKKDSNPEVKYAIDNNIIIAHRSDLLAEITKRKNAVTVSGSHGKTTTTALVSHVFDKLGLAPTIINGGIINSYNTNAKLGKGKWVVAEADESDGSFVKFSSKIAVVTNIDPEHLDHYKNFENELDAFVNYIQNVTLEGFACVCIDNINIKNILPKINNKKIITYGTDFDAIYQAINIKINEEGINYDILINKDEKKEIKNVHLNIFGKHNVLNSLACFAICFEMGYDAKDIINALKTFSGVKRRFTKVAEVNGISIIDDYGHHPEEIKAVLNTARIISKGKILVFFQPHRYSRLNSLFEDFCNCFQNADKIFVTDVYAAGETPINGIDNYKLAEGIKSTGHKDAHAFDKENMNFENIIKENAKNGDMVIFLGAGDISKTAYQTAENMLKIKDK